MSTTQLYKNSETGKWSGVLSGYAEYKDFDPALVRIAYALFALVIGVLPGVLLYGILSFCLTENPKTLDRRRALSSLVDLHNELTNKR